MNNRANNELRAELKRLGVYLWEISELAGYSQASNFSVELRKELTPRRKAELLRFAEQVSKNKQEAEAE